MFGRLGVRRLRAWAFVEFGIYVFGLVVSDSQVEVVLVSDSSEEVADSFSRHDSTVPLGADSTKLEVGWGAVV